MQASFIIEKCHSTFSRPFLRVSEGRKTLPIKMFSVLTDQHKEKLNKNRSKTLVCEREKKRDRERARETMAAGRCRFGSESHQRRLLSIHMDLLCSSGGTRPPQQYIFYTYIKKLIDGKFSTTRRHRHSAKPMSDRKLSDVSVLPRVPHDSSEAEPVLSHNVLI